MPYKKFDLPEYPYLEDVWDKIRNETRPIIVYGMGNGADKLFQRLSDYGVTVSDVFASQGFVRGHSFRGIRVKSFDEIRASYPDFVVLVSFASNKSDVLDMIEALCGEYTVYIPDMPIADVNTYFDKDFYNKNYSKIKSVYDSLADEDSRSCFAAVLHYKLSGEYAYLKDSYSSLSDMYALFDKERIKTAVDVGAYNGDTIREIKDFFDNVTKIVGIEPDRKNFKRLLKYRDSITEGVVPDVINAAAYSYVGVEKFSGSGNRNSTISATASYEHKSEDVSVITVDSLNVFADYIKYDTEGAEAEALEGSLSTIEHSLSQLLVSLYHRSVDIFDIPLSLMARFPGRRYYIRRLRCFPAWEVNLIVI